jgi:hypothetical protein
MVRRRRLLLLLPVTALALAACGSEPTTGSGAPATGSGTPATATPAASTSAAPADNGVSALTAEQILTRAKTALGAADSVHIAGSGTDEGSAIELDMRYGKDGAVGTMTLDGDVLNLLRVGDDVYLKGSRSFWTTYANAAVAKLMGVKYVKTSVGDDRFTDIASFTDLSESADGFLEPDGTITKSGKRTIAGQPAIGLVSRDETDGILYVATTGRPYPLSIEAKGNNLTFTGYGEPVTVRAPAAAQIVDADTLPGS